MTDGGPVASTQPVPPVRAGGMIDPPLPEHPDAPDLLHGGMLYRVMRRFGVEPEHAIRAARRGAIAALVLWAPMAALCLLEGTAFPGRVRVPFLLDVAAYVRPLISLPLLLVAEPILGTAWKLAGTRMRERGIVGPESREAYEALVARVTRAVRRFVPELLCLAVAGLLVFKLVTTVLSAPRDLWFATTDAAGTTRLTIAGGWYGVVVHGALFYLSLRWLWLLSLWYRFLFGVSRLPIRLYPAHPDRAGGLGFVGWTIAAGAPLIFAWSAALASSVANHVIHLGERLVDFAPVGIVFLAFVLVVFVLPPVVIFAPRLTRVRRRALEEWSRRMARATEEARGVPAPTTAAAPAEAADGLGDIEGIEIAVSAVRAMRPLPFAMHHLVGPLVAAAVPAVPLLLLIFSPGELLNQVMKLLF